MEVISSKTHPTICLNMIVKNESHIIEDTLKKLCEKINFDYWVISDTGSNDNTPEIITNFFNKKGISGELYHDKWLDFAHNRTLALKYAYNKTDLLMVFDADDEIIGNPIIPTEVLFDNYHFKFGGSEGTSYTRVLLINNKKKYEYLSVIHEFITCKEPNSKETTIEGNYYVISGRSGSRNNDPNKYLKDAITLEKAYNESIAKDGFLSERYSFYCANSYKDCGRYQDAIKWYKITLDNKNQWKQELYISCQYIYECYKNLNQEETGFFYLVKSFSYDSDRVECLYPLLTYYCCNNMHKIAYNYYLNVKDYYENRFLTTDLTHKLFISNNLINFYVPYYMILIADKVNDYHCVITMFTIIFKKKCLVFNEFYVNNLLFNLQFFIKHIRSDLLQNFINLTHEYVNFLYDNNINISKLEFLKKHVYTNAGFNFNKFIVKEVTDKNNKFSQYDCLNSKNILIFTGFMDRDWNYTYMINNALGGSEKAVAYLTKWFPKDYNIFITGCVQNEQIENIQYINLNELNELINKKPFHTVIVSRYISFYEMYPNCSFYRSYIWAHDTNLLNIGCSLTDYDILNKWNKYIDGCICLTEWHKNLYTERYSILKDRITIINNGIDVDSFNSMNGMNMNMKIKNKFIYTSRPERGLDILLKLWPTILEKMPDATLVISCYGNFPSNQEEIMLQDLINKYPDSIKHLGRLKVNNLYEEMSTSEYWLYPTSWPETSCITALEMLMSGVISLYYPVAGLIDTVGKYGIQIQSGNEIQTILNLSDEEKNKLIENGRNYAISCSWKNRAKEWEILMNKKKVFKSHDNHDMTNDPMTNDPMTNDPMTNDHVKYLKKLLLKFEPKIIYNIGSNALIWRREAKNIWPKSDFFAFDPLNNFECLYKKHNINYHIGVLSSDDNKFVKNYENTQTLSSVVKNKKFPLPDLIKMYIQDNELDIIKGGLDVINSAKYLIVELENIQYNRGEPEPLAQTTIEFFEKNGWELLSNNFCDNGPDAEYCFVNSKYKKWIVYVDPNYMLYQIDDYINSLKTKYNIEFTCDRNRLLNEIYDEVSILPIYDMEEIYDDIYHEIYKKLKENNTIVNILDLEPLNIISRMELLIKNYNYLKTMLNKNIKIYTYSLSNISLLELNDIRNVKHLPYIVYEIEKKYLSHINEITDKIYDFGIISHFNPVGVVRRKTVVDFLIKNGFSVKIINGWGETRDKQLAECKIILNIHGFWGEIPLIFEHIRCDRLLAAGYKILSEYSLFLNEEFIKTYCDNLLIIPYDKFFSLDFYKKLDWLTLENNNLKTDNLKTDNLLSLNKDNDVLHKKYYTQPYLLNTESIPSSLDMRNVIDNLEISLNYEPFVFNKIKIIDCFIFYNEINMLTYRLNALNDVVDYFILVEANQTHIGKPKNLFYQDNKHLFEKFNEKIIHIVVDLPLDYDKINFTNDEQWCNEIFQRNCISQGIDKIKDQLSDHDYIIIADVDEIPDPNILLKIKNNVIKNDINILEQDFYYYNLNSIRNEKWYHCKSMKYKKYKELNISCNDIRFYDGEIIKNAGWHLSYFGDVEFIKNKLENFAHQEFNSDEYTNKNKIEDRINNNLDLFGRDSSSNNNGIKNIHITDNDYLPPLYDTYLTSFYKN